MGNYILRKKIWFQYIEMQIQLVILMGQSFLLLNSYFVKDIEPPLPPAMDWLVN